jgi:hypothetical protein
MTGQVIQQLLYVLIFCIRLRVFSPCRHAGLSAGHAHVDGLHRHVPKQRQLPLNQLRNGPLRAILIQRGRRRR